MSVLAYYSPAEDQAHTGLHTLAVLTTVATFPLIFMGGLVTSHGAGLSVPDWPNSYGYNMFLFPISQWRGGIFFEHTHRLMGTIVGFCSILLVLKAFAPAQRTDIRRWLIIATGFMLGLAGLLAGAAVFSPQDTPAAKTMHNAIVQSAMGFLGIAIVLGASVFMRVPEPRKWVRVLTLGVLGAVIVQGLLGGLRVVLVQLDLAIVHACIAQAFFCMAALVAVVTSKWWVNRSTQVSIDGNSQGHRLIVLVAACVSVIYLQLIVGAMMRHYQAGLAIPDFPLNYGSLVPPTNDATLNIANQQRIGLQLPPVTLGQVWLHFGHRLGAAIVAFHLVMLITRILRRHNEPALCRPAIILAVLLAMQVTLGVLTVLMRKPADIASSHVAVGALILMTTFVLLARSMRLYSPLWREAPRGSENTGPKPSIVTA